MSDYFFHEFKLWRIYPFVGLFVGVLLCNLQESTFLQNMFVTINLESGVKPGVTAGDRAGIEDWKWCSVLNGVEIIV